MIPKKTPDKIAKELAQLTRFMPEKKRIVVIAQALRDAREAAIDECAATIECPSCANKGDSNHVNAHDSVNKILALKKVKS